MKERVFAEGGCGWLPGGGGGGMTVLMGYSVADGVPGGTGWLSPVTVNKID